MRLTLQPVHTLQHFFLKLEKNTMTLYHVVFCVRYMSHSQTLLKAIKMEKP